MTDTENTTQEREKNNVTNTEPVTSTSEITVSAKCKIKSESICCTCGLAVFKSCPHHISLLRRSDTFIRILILKFLVNWNDGCQDFYVIRAPFGT